MITESLECPCCGDVGARPDACGYYDAQPLTCGCPGMVSIDKDDGPWINNGDDRCPKCEAPAGTVIPTSEDRSAAVFREMKHRACEGCTGDRVLSCCDPAADDPDATLRLLDRALTDLPRVLVHEEGAQMVGIAELVESLSEWLRGGGYSPRWDRYPVAAAYYQDPRRGR